MPIRWPVFLAGCWRCWSRFVLQAEEGPCRQFDVGMLGDQVGYAVGIAGDAQILQWRGSRFVRLSRSRVFGQVRIRRNVDSVQGSDASAFAAGAARIAGRDSAVSGGSLRLQRQLRNGNLCSDEGVKWNGLF